MYVRLTKRLYWPNMEADVVMMIQMFEPCARNRLQFRKRTNPMQLLPTREPPASIVVDILVPLPKCNSGRIFLMVIIYRFSELTQAIPLVIIDSYTITRAFV